MSQPSEGITLAREQIRRAKREVERIADDLIASLVCAKRGCLTDSHIDHMESRLRELKETATAGQRWERELEEQIRNANQ
jgi:hypothetical protein